MPLNASALSESQIWQAMSEPTGPENPVLTPTIASAAAIDLTQVPPSKFYHISGTTTITSMKPPFAGFTGLVILIFDGATPPSVNSGGSPATGFFGFALSKSPSQFEWMGYVLDNSMGTPVWFPQH